MAEEHSSSGDALKRPADGSDESGGELKKRRTEELEEKSAEEERVEEMSVSGRIGLGPKSFESSVEMFDYFFKLIHHWPPYLNLNKYEHMVLLELVNKGHPEPEKKVGEEVHAFQIRIHPKWKSKCFFIIRNDESAEDFSFRKCVDKILPLPEDMQIKHDVNKKLGGRDYGRGGKGARGARGRGHFHGGRGRGDKARH